MTMPVKVKKNGIRHPLSEFLHSEVTLGRILQRIFTNLNLGGVELINDEDPLARPNDRHRYPGQSEAAEWTTKTVRIC